MPHHNASGISLQQIMSVIDDGELPSYPDMEAQRMELRDRFERYHAPAAPLLPGMFVREKRGLGVLKPELRDRVVRIMWRMLDFTDPQDRVIADSLIGIAHVNRVDCIVAELTPTGDNAVLMPHDTKMLEPAE